MGERVFDITAQVIVKMPCRDESAASAEASVLGHLRRSLAAKASFGIEDVRTLKVEQQPEAT